MPRRHFQRLASEIAARSDAASRRCGDRELAGPAVLNGSETTSMRRCTSHAVRSRREQIGWWRALQRISLGGNHVQYVLRSEACLSVRRGRCTIFVFAIAAVEHRAHQRATQLAHVHQIAWRMYVFHVVAPDCDFGACFRGNTEMSGWARTRKTKPVYLHVRRLYNRPGVGYGRGRYRTSLGRFSKSDISMLVPIDTLKTNCDDHLEPKSSRHLFGSRITSQGLIQWDSHLHHLDHNINSYLIMRFDSREVTLS